MNNKKYEHECCRCGLCCVNEACKVARFLGWNNSESGNALCPALSYDVQGVSTCRVANFGFISPEFLGIGAGCCISARAFKDGQPYDFASLPDGIKRDLALKLYHKKMEGLKNAS